MTQSVLTKPAERMRAASVQVWGQEAEPLEIVGVSQAMQSLLETVEKIALFDEPVLILGESGVGKEGLAQAIHLLSPRQSKSFVSVNCPQFQEGSLTVSELFGHKKGSFTGAVADRKGAFEVADGGVAFLDEIGDLPMSTQIMLLRALATGEFRVLGENRVRRTTARVVAATNRNLNQLASEKEFRRDLLFRLRSFLVQVPPLRERDSDWELILSHALKRLQARYGEEKHFSKPATRLLEQYRWPGNVRELIGLTTTAYALSDGQAIEPKDFAGYLESGRGPSEFGVDAMFHQLMSGNDSFWDLIHSPFMERDLNRGQVRQLIARGLRRSEDGYRGLLDLWSMPGDDYQRFMDFLRHHRLKPRGAKDSEARSQDAPEQGLHP